MWYYRYGIPKEISFSIILLVEQDNSNLIFCQKLLSIKDPFIFESIISIVTGIGLRAKETSTINNCISILEDYLANYNSNHIVLLDDLETLYSYGEDLYGQTYDRNILYKNRDEFWRQSDIENFSFIRFMIMIMKNLISDLYMLIHISMSLIYRGRSIWNAINKNT